MYVHIYRKIKKIVFFSQSIAIHSSLTYPTIKNRKIWHPLNSSACLVWVIIQHARVVLIYRDYSSQTGVIASEFVAPDYRLFLTSVNLFLWPFDNQYCQEKIMEKPKCFNILYMTILKAMEECQSASAWLVEIQTEEQQDFVVKMAKVVAILKITTTYIHVFSKY